MLVSSHLFVCELKARMGQTDTDKQTNRTDGWANLSSGLLERPHGKAEAKTVSSAPSSKDNRQQTEKF